MTEAQGGMGGDKGMKMAGAMAVVAGRAVRPCDVCGLKRARLYCAADEAYLCEACDSSVHAANAVALRHERVRLAPNGGPMKMDRRSNTNDRGEPLRAPAFPPKKKLKIRPSVRPSSVPVEPPAKTPGTQLREVKVELSSGTNAIEPADDHFTAEELTGNANLDDESICPNSGCDHCSTTTGGCNHGTVSESDFAHDFLVSDPTEASNNSNKNCRRKNDNHGRRVMKTSSAGGEEQDVAEEEEEEDEDDDEDKQDGSANGWMELDLGDRDLSDDEYCLDLAALRGSVSAAAGSHDQSATTYGDHQDSNDNKQALNGPCGLPKAGKPFKNIAGQSEWVKLEQGAYHDMQQSMAAGCKMEGLNECDLRQVPTLRLDYADVLSSWPDRGMLWTDVHGNINSQFVPDSSNSDGTGNCYDLGLVPDLSSARLGVGQVPTMYGGCGAGDDSGVSAGISREARVIRYREKRRTRLFSKKIRYEVRKLNAERRPRMKGRFVKRSPGRD